MIHSCRGEIFIAVVMIAEERGNSWLNSAEKGGSKKRDKRKKRWEKVAMTEKVKEQMCNRGKFFPH